MLKSPGRPKQSNPTLANIDKMKKENNYCEKCRNYKPDRAHHCQHCGKCTLRMDHHCPWIMNCVGINNIKQFYLLSLFLAFAGIQTVLTGVYFFFFDHTPELVDHSYKKFPMLIFYLMFLIVSGMMSFTLLAIVISHMN